MYWEQYERIIWDYVNLGRGPSKSKSFNDFFESEIVKEFIELQQKMQNVFETKYNEIQMVVIEYAS